MEIKSKINFIGIGVQKAATTFIFKKLAEHPEVCGSSKKEIHFFDKEYNYSKGIKFYHSFFQHCSDSKIKGEFTPRYIYHPKTASRIKKHFPNVKLIVCLRNPIERARSHYFYSLQQKGRLFYLYNSFGEAIRKDKILIERGFYYKQLKRYFDLFPKENILVLFFEDLKSNPKNFIQKIYSFLDVDDNFVPSNIKEKKHVTGDKIVKEKFPFLNFVLYKLRSLIKENSLIDIILEKLFIKKFFKKITIFNKKKVKNKENINKLEKLLNIDLSNWKK